MARILILIVEDTVADLELITQVLRASGYITCIAHDGEEGLEVAERERPDLVICDVNLPRINGYEVVRRMKANMILGRVPVIAVTAFARIGERENMLAAGFDGYISKPISLGKFVQEIASFLGPERRAGDQPHR